MGAYLFIYIYIYSVQANPTPVGLVVRFAPCRLEFEPSRGRICWPQEAQFYLRIEKQNSLVYPR